jgi:hypothetical protein
MSTAPAPVRLRAVSMTTTSQSTRVFPGRVPAPAVHQWRWMRLAVWSVILAGCLAFWAGVIAVLLTL